MHRKKNTAKKISKVYQNKMITKKETNEKFRNEKDENDFIQFKIDTSSNQLLSKEGSNINEKINEPMISGLIGKVLFKKIYTYCFL
jgi:hypothetical protein